MIFNEKSGSGITLTTLNAAQNQTYNAPSGTAYNQVVVNVPTGSEIELSSIAITTPPTKTAYSDGESFDPTGMVVTATYSNGATRAINSFSSGFTFSPNPLAYTGSAVSVTVSMTEYGVTKTATQSVTVKAALSSIAITTAPTRTTYFEGDTFSPAGMVVTATYADGTSAAVTGYTFTPSGSLALSDTSVTISYTEGVVTKTATQAITVEAVPANTVYGAYWVPGSSTKWTRTDAAASFSDPVPYVAGASIYGSPFDGLSPWQDMTIYEDANAGTMVKIPKFWYKLESYGTGGLSIKISNEELPGYSVCPACADRGDDAGERDYVYVGRYHCGNTAYKSATGQTPKINLRRTTFRTSIHNLGSTVWQYDFAMRFTIFLLYLVEYADWNSQNVIGYGCGNNSSVGAVGYTDSMPYHTGTTLGSRTTYGLGTQYRNIEGLWDNVYDWLDGCYYNSSGMNIILSPASFSDISGGTSIGSPTSGYPSKFGVSSAAGIPLFLPTEASGNDHTGSCDFWYFSSSSNPCVACGGLYGQSLNTGLFFFNYFGVADSYAFISARPMILP